MQSMTAMSKMTIVPFRKSGKEWLLQQFCHSYKFSRVEIVQESILRKKLVVEQSPEGFHCYLKWSAGRVSPTEYTYYLQEIGVSRSSIFVDISKPQWL